VLLLVSSSERIKKGGGNVGARLHRAAIQIVAGAGAVNRAGAQNDFAAEGRDSVRVFRRTQEEEICVGNSEPIISVVIPTLNRPHLVVRALWIALAQTLDTIEVVVVVDGPDDLTIEALGAIENSWVVIKMLPRNVGPAEARNEGVE
jgi:cellulose synthase/poly-beta-1,6-N-acetylglucosamine synthase-like glycosyltransferase